MNWTQEDITAIHKAMWMVTEEMGGPKWGIGDPEAYVEGLKQWLDNEPDKFVPWAAKSREAILSFVPKHGLASSDELPESILETLHEHCQTVVAATVQAVNDRLIGEFRNASPARRIMILERAKIDLDQAVEQAADINEPERKGWLKMILPLRDDCQRAAKKLRKNL